MLFNLNYYGLQTLEIAPFEINRPEGSPRYIFFHFSSSVNVEIDGEVFSSPPGSCILYSPGNPHRFFVDYVNLNHDYLDFTCSDPQFFDNIRLPLNTIISPKMSNTIISSIQNIHNENNANRLGSEYIIQSIMENLFVSISRKTHNFSFNSADYEKTLQRKFEKMRLDFYNDPGKFRVKSMAKELDFSITHFSYLYKKFFNITPMNDLTKARIDYVKNIDIININTYELSELLGFNSIEYFYRWFKTHFKMTQREYKANLRED